MNPENSPHRFPYRWKLADGFPAKGVKPNGRTVFGTFVCGGGSAMGYKLAGFDYLGGVEIDPKVAAIYAANLHPRHLYVEDIRAFNKRDDLPAELYNLDILDGSPPCTLFSLNRGRKREDAWGKARKFGEGQAVQTLEDLPFVWCETVAKLRPKVCLMENVEGLVKGGAKAYCSNIIWKLGRAGYDAQLFVLDAQFMGVPQRRRRVFIIGRRRDLNLPRLALDFREPVIPAGEVRDGNEPSIENVTLTQWKLRQSGDRTISDTVQRAEDRVSNFATAYVYPDAPCATLVQTRHVWFDSPTYTSDRELLLFASFPTDYEKGGGQGYLSHGDVRPARHDRQHRLRNQPPNVPE